MLRRLGETAYDLAELAERVADKAGAGSSRAETRSR
jgi:hypothetical protein